MAADVPQLKLGLKVEDGINWLTTNLAGLFDAISSVMTSLVDAVTNVLTGPPYYVWVIIFTVAALLARGIAFGVFTVLAFLLIDSFRLWEATMQTLGVVIVAAAIAAIIGVPLGVWSARRNSVRAVLRPILDTAQTTPSFVYLIPAVFFFGIGVVPGVVATTIFAIPPAVRLTDLGIRQVDPEVVEAAHAFGAHPRQILREVQIPMALPTIMAGINQVIMLGLSMVVVAGLAGAPGLGANVVGAVSQLDIATGFESGVAVVVLAIFLDRLTSAAAERPKSSLWSKLQHKRSHDSSAPAADAAAPAGLSDERDALQVPAGAGVTVRN
jgi:glycine betaine/proline transport system permease protein